METIIVEAIMKTLYYNGHIITMTSQPMPQAVLCENGKIIATGNYDILKTKADCFIDLKGKTMLPAFIDGHSHFTTVANTLAIADLSQAKSIEEIKNILNVFVDNKGQIGDDEFIVGFGYDNNFLPEKAHPTKTDLDSISTQYPVVISHASGHMGVANTKALEIMGIDEKTPDPEGGKIGRNSDDSLNGYLEETAFTTNTAVIKQPGYEDMCRYAQQAQQMYFKYGITTIQDGFTGLKEWGLLKKLSDDGHLIADIVSYVDINTCPQILTNNSEYNKNYIKNLKIGGYKLFLDGSPQGRTAWMTYPYENSKDYCGYPIYNDKQVLEFVKKAISEKQQLLCHCNGDAAARQFIDAYFEADSRLGTQDNYRPVLIHGQLATPRQMELLHSLGMIVSFFVAHTWQWGDIHLENFGERAMKICPVNSALNNNAVTTFHQDTPVLPPDMMHTVWCAVNRLTQNGVQLDKSESVSVYDALKSITINAAYQYGEENIKGTIEIEKEASFVILSDNPLLCDKNDINKIKVLQTILRGETVYSA